MKNHILVEKINLDCGNEIDGEVEEFTLLHVEEVEEILQTSMRYKPNCALVIIDFLFRHGYATPFHANNAQLN